MIRSKFYTENHTKIWRPEHIPNNVWESDWPYAFLDFKDDFDVLEKEAIELPSKFWTSHRAKDSKGSYSHQGWESCTLHGISYDKTENYDRYGFKSIEEANYTWTDVCKYVPKITQFIKNLNFITYERVRLMKLAPGGYIMPHKDGKTRIFGPFNIALNNPEGCEFVFEDYGVVPFKKGRGVFPDIGNIHAVYNNTDQERIHLILHGEVNPNIMAEAVNTTFNGLY